MMTPLQSNQSRPDERVVRSESPDGLPIIELTGDFGKACFSTQGAHLMEFTPKDQPPLLFMSRQTFRSKGKAVRGGVPLIFPWFGPREGHPESPMHGLVRTREWELRGLEVPDKGPAKVRMDFESNEETEAIWPHAFALSIEFILGEDLHIRWISRNTGEKPFVFEQALHPYFPVLDVHNVSVRGLQFSEFIDKTDDMRLKVDREDSVRFTAETDRLYLDTSSPLSIEDPASRSRIEVGKTGSQSSVVWNPWIAKAASLSDLADEEWREFVCVEQVNASRNRVKLSPGEKHTLETRYGRKPLC
jgi:glucose-6-phosphate 1-epimerase